MSERSLFFWPDTEAMTMRRARLGALPAVVTLLLCCLGPAAAEPVFYVAPSAYPTWPVAPAADVPWQTDVTTHGGSFSEFDFESYAVGATINSLTAGSLSININGENPQGTGCTVFQSGLFSGSGGGSSGTVYSKALLNGSAGAQSSAASAIAFTFSSPVYGFGAWVFDDNDDSPESFDMTVREVGGDVWTSSVLESGNGNHLFVEGWLAASSTVGIEKVWITQLDSTGTPVGGRYFELDHIQVAGALPLPSDVIPEPFSLAFMGSAFVGVVGWGLRRRTKQRQG